jgi:ubiquinone/menaquinone biosynthesis C-methylase UbiE
VSERDHVASARAVYDASVERYVQFVGAELGAAMEAPLDRSMLDTFVEMIEARGGASVADVGCGPGRVAAHLASRGLSVIGVDVSSAMIAHARRAHPAISFEEGRLDRIPLQDGSLAGMVCWYSIIYTPPGDLDEAFDELRRVLQADGLLLLAFQAGNGQAWHQADAHGTGLPLTSSRHSFDQLAERLEVAGFRVQATAQRQPELAHESTPQGFIVAIADSAGVAVTTPGR